MNKEIEIPFGYKVRIEGNKVIIEQKPVECIEFDNEFKNQVSHLLASVLNKEWEYDKRFVEYAAQQLLGYEKEEKKLPDGLEEAAKEYATKWHKRPDGSEWKSIYPAGTTRDFIAGAEWGMNQCPLPEDTTTFLKGVAEGRRLEREEQKPAECSEEDGKC